MNKKKLILLILILIIIFFIVYFIYNNISISKTSDENFAEYTPEEEISDSQATETSISLYFLDTETNTLKSEGKLVNAKDLIENPYKLIVQKLLEGPSGSKMEAVFPENTRLIDTSFTNNCVTINFSEDLLNFSDDTQKYNIINSLLNSLNQLNEVNSIKILINNESHAGIDQEYAVIS